MSALIYFITHPDVDIDPDIDITDWSPSNTGIKRMHRLLDLNWANGIQTIVCSCEKKAVDGADILARHLKLPYQTLAEPGENDRSATGYLPPAEFESVADEFFAKPFQSVRGWETAHNAQKRIVAAVQTTTDFASQENNPVAIVSHGAVGTLLLCHLSGLAIEQKHDQPGNGGGNFFCFEATSGKICTAGSQLMHNNLCARMW